MKFIDWFFLNEGRTPFNLFISYVPLWLFEPLISKDTRFLLQRITNEILSTSVTSDSSYPRYILLFNYDFVHNVKYLKMHYNLYLSLKNNMDIDIF